MSPCSLRGQAVVLSFGTPALSFWMQEQERIRTGKDTSRLISPLHRCSWGEHIKFSIRTQHVHKQKTQKEKSSVRAREWLQKSARPIPALHHLKGPQPSTGARVQAPQGLTENSTLKRQPGRARARSARWREPGAHGTCSQEPAAPAAGSPHSQPGAQRHRGVTSSTERPGARDVPSTVHIDGAAIASSRSGFRH